MRRKTQGTQGTIAHLPMRRDQDGKGLEDLLRQKAQLEAMLAGYQKFVTILLSDIVGSTAYYHRMGDLAGRLMIQKHNDLLIPEIAGHQGEVLRTTGDGVLAIFARPTDAVASAVTIQNRFYGYNAAQPDPQEEIHIRVSIHAGVGILEADDVFGDVINTASRINSYTDPDQILITDAVHKHLDDARKATCQPRGEVPIRGTGSIRPVFEIAWRPGAVAGETVRPIPVDPADRIVTDDKAGPRSIGDARTAVLRSVRGHEPVVLTPGQVAEIAKAPALSLEQYFVGRFAEWSQPRYRLNTRFVQLSLMIDQGEDARNEQWALREKRIRDLRRLLVDVPDPVLVLLAPPGAGKSTILRRLELEAAVDALSPDQKDPIVPFFIQLNHYKASDPGSGLPDPWPWLKENWAARYPDLPDLETLLRQSRVLLLLDALNEIPTTNDAEFRIAVRMWKGFLHSALDQWPRLRIVFSCRSLDYSAPLSSPSLRVPQVVVEPLTNDQIVDFVKLHCPLQWDEIWAELSTAKHIDLFRRPYFLRLLVDQIEDEGRIPKGRAGLFTGFVRQALRREIERDNTLFDDEALLTSRDRRQIVAWRWKSPTDLPERGALLQGLQKLAHRMQATQGGSEAAHVRIDYDEAIACLDDPRGPRILEAGIALAIVDEETSRDEILFTHQLVQEYFAARAMAGGLDPAALLTAWRACDVHPRISDALQSLAPAEPLPPLPSTGWGGDRPAGGGDGRGPGRVRGSRRSGQPATRRPMRRPA